MAKTGQKTTVTIPDDIMGTLNLIMGVTHESLPATIERACREWGEQTARSAEFAERYAAQQAHHSATAARFGLALAPPTMTSKAGPVEWSHDCGCSGFGDTIHKFCVEHAPAPISPV